MSKRIENYVDSLFIETRMSKKAVELKEEVLANCMDRYNDYLSQGFPEAQAFNMTLSSLGDIDALLDDLKATKDDMEEIKAYRKRNAIVTATAVMLFIISIIALIGFATYGESIGLEDEYAVIGLIVMFVMIAIGVGLLIYISMTTPKELKFMQEDEPKLSSKNKLKLKMIDTIIWISALGFFFLVGFVFNMWGVSWIVFPIAAALSSITSAVLELRENYE